MPAGHQHRPAGNAHCPAKRTGAIIVSKAVARVCESVQVRRFYCGVSVRPNRVGALVIGKQQDNVRFFNRQRSRGRN